MQNGVSKYISNDKISIIPNFSNNDIYFPRKKNLSLNDKYNLVNDSFKIIYFGSMGIANGIDIIINTAKLFENDINVEFIFVGDGSEKTKAMNKCSLLGIKNVQFLGKIPMIDLPELINLCDISIVTFKDIPILSTNSPNKFFDSLASGKPILLNSNGWTKDIIEKNKCGFYFDSKDKYALFNLINDLKHNNKLLSLMSRNSKNIALKYFDKTILINKFSKIVQNILS
jgi:glycosyltransferase involved in cell wall biosynthesis